MGRRFYGILTQSCGGRFKINVGYVTDYQTSSLETLSLFRWTYLYVCGLVVEVETLER